MADSPYEVLGVPVDATQNDIKSAWRKLVRDNHTDTNPSATVDGFTRIQKAYELLSDPKRRALYDKLNQSTVPPQGQPYYTTPPLYTGGFTSGSAAYYNNSRPQVRFNAAFGYAGGGYISASFGHLVFVVDSAHVLSIKNSLSAFSVLAEVEVDINILPGRDHIPVPGDTLRITGGRPAPDLEIKRVDIRGYILRIVAEG